MKKNRCEQESRRVIRVLTHSHLTTSGLCRGCCASQVPSHDIFGYFGLAFFKVGYPKNSMVYHHNSSTSILYLAKTNLQFLSILLVAFFVSIFSGVAMVPIEATLNPPVPEDSSGASGPGRRRERRRHRRHHWRCRHYHRPQRRSDDAKAGVLGIGAQVGWGQRLHFGILSNLGLSWFVSK